MNRTRLTQSGFALLLAAATAACSANAPPEPTGATKSADSLAAGDSFNDGTSTDDTSTDDTSTATTASTPTGPCVLGIVDVNGDGHPDAVVVDADRNGAPDFPAPLPPCGIVAFDPNGDGVPDALDLNCDGVPDIPFCGH